METTLCVNEEKAKQRVWVMKAFSIWLDSLQNFVKTRQGNKYTAKVGTVYSLPATLWDFESFVAARSLQMSEISTMFGVKHSGQINLHCFENDESTYCAQTGTRAFMRNDNDLYPNFNGEYHLSDIPSNQHAKNNFAAWYDFTGVPSQSNLDIVTDPKNFVHNSLVFATFDACVIAKSCMPDEIISAVDSRIEERGGIMADHITDVVVDYINERTGNKVKCIMSVEYQAQKHPMMMIGFSNCVDVLKVCNPIRSRINRATPKSPKSAPLSDSKKSQLASDLKYFRFTRDELCDMYKCTPAQVGAIKAHHGGGYA